MTNLEFCVARRKAELPTFVKVLKALPAVKLDYRPHPKSRTAGELAWLLASSEGALVELLDKGTIAWKESPPPARLEDIVGAFERNSAAVDERLEKLDAAGWEKKGRFVMEGMPPWEDAVGQFVWGFFFDSIHHRGQLTAYLRPMGGKVPSIYGPSGDDPGGQ
jgi:uncharacterized damage-inducible protein DinB